MSLQETYGGFSIALIMRCAVGFFFFALAMISSPWLSRLEIRVSLSVVPFLDQEAHPHPYDSDRECSPFSPLPCK